MGWVGPHPSTQATGQACPAREQSWSSGLYLDYLTSLKIIPGV